VSDYAQKKGETAAAWVARLASVSTAGLSGYVQSVLGSWRRDAAAKADAEPAAPAASRAAGVAPPAAAVSPPLDAAKRAVQALSPLDLARFTVWLTQGRRD